MMRFLKEVLKRVILSNFFSSSLINKALNILSGSFCIIAKRNDIHSTVLLRGVKLRDKGENNKVTIECGSILRDCHMYFFGNNNKVYIGKDTHIGNLTIWIEDNYNEVEIHDHTSIYGKTQLACIEGCKITIGQDCMFSSEISIRTGDSHTVLNLSGKRTNPSKDIVIGNHVWIGTKVFISKGVHIADNSIVGAGSLVTKEFSQSNIIIAGNPAKIVKENIDWKRERI